MKVLFALLCLAVAAQAANWAKVRPLVRKMQTHGPAPLNSGRIIGGTAANLGEFPFQVGLFIDGSGFCGGSLISTTTVLTAAHCATNSVFHDVHAGCTLINDMSEPSHVVVRSTDHVVHENYNGITLNNDVAVIRLPSAINGANTGTIRLPSRSMAGDTFEGQTATSSGWGRFSDINPSISDYLRWVEVTIISNAECEAVYSIVNSCTLCISTNGGTEGVCNGDSGGPLTITEADGVKTQVGVTSFVASAGCETAFPHGYQRTTCHLDWIATNGGVPVRP